MINSEVEGRLIALERAIAIVEQEPTSELILEMFGLDEQYPGVFEAAINAVELGITVSNVKSMLTDMLGE